MEVIPLQSIETYKLSDNSESMKYNFYWRQTIDHRQNNNHLHKATKYTNEIQLEYRINFFLNQKQILQ